MKHTSVIILILEDKTPLSLRPHLDKTDKQKHQEQEDYFQFSYRNKQGFWDEMFIELSPKKIERSYY